MSTVKPTFPHFSRAAWVSHSSMHPTCSVTSTEGLGQGRPDQKGQWPHIPLSCWHISAASLAWHWFDLLLYPRLKRFKNLYFFKTVKKKKSTWGKKKKKTVNHFLPTYRGGHSPEIRPRTTYCLRKPWESRTDGLVGRRGAQQAESAQLCPHS